MKLTRAGHSHSLPSITSSNSPLRSPHPVDEAEGNTYDPHVSFTLTTPQPLTQISLSPVMLTGSPPRSLCVAGRPC